MPKTKKPRCELCGETRKTTSTIFNGRYCIDCYKTLIEHSQAAIKEIKSQK